MSKSTVILVDALSEGCLPLVQDGLVRAASKVALCTSDSMSQDNISLCQGAHSAVTGKELQLEVFVSSSSLSTKRCILI